VTLPSLANRSAADWKAPQAAFESQSGDKCEVRNHVGVARIVVDRVRRDVSAYAGRIVSGRIRQVKAIAGIHVERERIGRASVDLADLTA
jgi:hypothetical protein